MSEPTSKSNSDRFLRITTRFATKFARLSPDPAGDELAEPINCKDILDRNGKATPTSLGNLVANLTREPCRPQYFEYQLLPLKNLVPRRFQWYIAEGMLSLPTAKWSMVISFFSGVMASGFAFGCAKDTVEFFNAGIGEVRFPVGEGFLLVIFDYVGPWV